MKQAPKRALSVVLAFCLVLTMFTGLISTQAASPFPDLSTSHWAYDVIVGMYNMGFVKGDNKGNVKPESYVTTTEFMALINRMFGLYLTTSTNYADTAGHWGNNENVFSYAAAQGYIIAESGNKIQPDAYLTREKAFALIARYLGLDEINYGGFTDSGSMSAAYRGLINAASVLGIAEGYPDGSFKPQQYLRRSEAMKILYYMVGGNIISGSSTGVYNSNVSKSQISAAITGRNAVLSNSTLRGTVYVSEGATNGTVTISNSSIGKLVVRASNVTINLQNSTVTEIETYASGGGNITINAAGTSSVGSVTAKTPTALADTTTHGSAFAKVTVLMPMTLSLTGTFPSVTVESTAAKTKITGKGTINYISVKASGVTTETLPVRYDIAKGLTAVFAGVTYSGSGTTSGLNSGFVAPYPYATVFNATNGTKTITVNVKTVAAGTVYALAYPATDSEPAYSTIISYANSTRGSYTGKSASVNANTATAITLTVSGGVDYEVAVLFVPTNGSQTTYSPVYGTTRENYTTYMGRPGNYDTGFAVNPQITAYTANTAYAAGSVTVSFQTVLPGTVYAYAYSGTVPTYATIKSYGTSVTMSAANGGYSGSCTLSLKANTTYTGVAAIFVPSYTTFQMTPVCSTALTTGSYLVPVSTEVSTGTGFYAGYPYISYYYGNTVKLTAKTQVKGWMFYAVVASDYYPTASEIAALTTSDSRCFSKGSMEVAAGVEKTTGTLSVPSNPAGYKLVAVVRAENGYYYNPVSSSIGSKNVLYSYVPNNSSGFAAGTPYVYSVSTDKRTVTLAATPLYTGTVYYAVVDSTYNPTAEQLVTLTTSSAYCYAKGTRAVTANTTYTDLSMELVYPYTVTNGMKVVAVLKTTSGAFVPVSGSIVSNSVLYPYTVAVTPTAVLTAPTAGEGKIADTSPLSLQFSELMYAGTVSTANLLSGKDDAALKKLFSVYRYNEETKKYEAIDSSLYTVSATDVSGKTLVTIKLAEGKTWPAGYALRVYVSNSVINASRLTVNPVNGYYQTSGTIVSTVTLPEYKVAMAGGVTGTVYNDVVYFEAGQEGVIATLTLTKKNASDKLYYKINDGAATEYTTALEIKDTHTKVEFWAENGGSKTDVKLITVVMVAKPVVTLNGTETGWVASSYATVAATVPSAGTLYIAGSAGENTLAAVKTTAGAKSYLAADGKSIVTTAPATLSIASGTALAFTAEIKVNNVVVAKSESVTAKVGAISGGEYAPSIEVKGLVNGMWANSSKLIVKEPKYVPSGATLKITSSVNSTVFTGAGTYYVTNKGALSKSEPTDLNYGNASIVTITAAYYEGGKQVAGTATTYTITDYVPGEAMKTLTIALYGTSMGEPWRADGYVQITATDPLPRDYCYKATLKINGTVSDTLEFTDSATKLYIDDSGKFATVKPSKSLEDGQKIAIYVEVVLPGTNYSIKTSNTIDRDAPAMLPKLIITPASSTTWNKNSSFTVTLSKPLPEMYKDYKVRVSINGQGMKVVTPGTSYYITEDGKLTTTAPEKHYTLIGETIQVFAAIYDGTNNVGGVSATFKTALPLEATFTDATVNGNFTAASTIRVTVPSDCTFDANWSWGSDSKTTTGLSTGTYYVDPDTGALQTSAGSGSFKAGNKTLTLTLKQGSEVIGSVSYNFVVA